jgi:radical SAM superfamily enzyme YgiQ (UPF0313 family)
MPLGLAYIAAALESDGHRVSVLDGFLEGAAIHRAYGPGIATGLPNDEIVRRMGEVDLVGISVMFTMDWFLAADLCRRIRARFGNIPIVLGGEHVTALPSFSLRTSGADVVVMGEGEDTAREVVAALGERRSLASIPGIAFRDGDRVVITPSRPRMREVKLRPAWHLFDVQGYAARGISNGGFRKGVSLPILATRGCPYQCTFCSAPTMWGAWRPRDPADVADEIAEAVRDFGARDFQFYDLTAVIRRDWAERLAREILQRKVDVTWQLGVGTRIEQFDRPLAKLLRQSGLSYVAFAPESGSEGTRSRVKKEIDKDDLERATDAALAEGLRVQYLMVLGFPDDSAADLWASVAFAWAAAARGIHDIGPNVFTPIPGTELFDDLLRRGAIELGEDLLFATIANYGFVPSFVTAKSPWQVIAALYGATAAFYGRRLLRAPGKSLREIVRSVSGAEDAGFLGRVVRSLGASLLQQLSIRERATWPPIDYRAFSVEELTARAAGREQYLKRSFTRDTTSLRMHR